MVFSSAADLAAIAAAVGAAAAGCTTAGLDGEVGATADDVPLCDGESGGGFTGALGANNACQPTTTSNESTAASSARRSAESSFTGGPLRGRPLAAPDHSRRPRTAGSAAGAAARAMRRGGRRAARWLDKRSASKWDRTCMARASAATGYPDRRASQLARAGPWGFGRAAGARALAHQALQQANQLRRERSELRPGHRAARVNDNVPS